MKNLINYVLIITFLMLISCGHVSSVDEYKKEIISTEAEFAELVQEKGVAEAFKYFAADDAVLNRNDTIIIGKQAISDYFNNSIIENIELEWNPDFVDVAKSGDLAYTYGQYTFTAKDTSGHTVKGSGIFHTVWKKQSDGNWKFVWD